jgi:hypothetical protein
MSDAASYGDTWAAIYDDVHEHLDPSAAVDQLAELAGNGRALELGIGTGRVAIPLAARGVAVDGIEASQAMLGRMRAKPGGENIRVTLGDFTNVTVDGEYALIYIVFSTCTACSRKTPRSSAFAAQPRDWHPMVCSSSKDSWPTRRGSIAVNACRSIASSQRASTCCSRVTIRSLGASQVHRSSSARRACSSIPSKSAMYGRASST